MKTRLTVLAMLVAMLMPALALAQSSTVVFNVFLDYEELNDDAFDGPTMEATVSCNAGSPLEQTATVGDDKDNAEVLFTVTDVPVDFDVSCTVSFGDTPDGWDNWFTDYDNAFGSIDDLVDFTCKFASIPDDFVLQIADYNKCELELIPTPFEFEVVVDWSVAEEADLDVGAGAMVELVCENLYENDGIGSSISSTTLYAGPDYEGPLLLTNMRPDPNGYYSSTTNDMSRCYARIVNVGSAIETEGECWYPDGGIDIDSTAPMPVCTIAATAFYEGIPTLSQYGMAIMALLMLGIGFVGFRRFV